jgi:hypothetical protein
MRWNPSDEEIEYLRQQAALGDFEAKVELFSLGLEDISPYSLETLFQQHGYAIKPVIEIILNRNSKRSFFSNIPLVWVGSRLPNALDLIVKYKMCVPATLVSDLFFENLHLIIDVRYPKEILEKCVRVINSLVEHCHVAPVVQTTIADEAIGILLLGNLPWVKETLLLGLLGSLNFNFDDHLTSIDERKILDILSEIVFRERDYVGDEWWVSVRLLSRFGIKALPILSEVLINEVNHGRCCFEGTAIVRAIYDVDQAALLDFLKEDAFPDAPPERKECIQGYIRGILADS